MYIDIFWLMAGKTKSIKNVLLVLLSFCLYSFAESAFSQEINNFSTSSTENLKLDLDKMLKFTPGATGPNCWNSVLVANGFVDNLRFSNENELDFWLSSKFCRPLSSEEPLSQGDIIRILTSEGNDLHSMIWVDEEQVFSKNTSHSFDPFQFIRADLVYSMFRVDSLNCRGTTEQLAKNLGCARWSKAYRCRTPAIEKAEAIKKSRAFKKLNSLTEQIGYFVESTVKAAAETKFLDEKDYLSWIHAKGEVLANRLDSLSSLMAKEEIDTRLKPQIESIEFFWKSLKLQLESLRVQAKIWIDTKHK